MTPEPKSERSPRERRRSCRTEWRQAHDAARSEGSEACSWSTQGARVAFLRRLARTLPAWSLIIVCWPLACTAGLLRVVSIKKYGKRIEHRLQIHHTVPEHLMPALLHKAPEWTSPKVP